jgi:hypothetical protein
MRPLVHDWPTIEVPVRKNPRKIANTNTNEI